MTKLPSVWMARRRPKEFDTAGLLLLDCSGSMAARGKIGAALNGAKLVAGALDLLRVPFAVYGFQDDVFPLVRFDQPFDGEARAALDGVVDIVEGRRSEYNDDGPAVDAAAELLERRPERSRLLIVISDGRPEGEYSDAKDLHRAVEKIQRAGNVTLVGVGLGAGTSHVKEFYPNSIADVAPRSFPIVLAALLWKLLQGADGAP